MTGKARGRATENRCTSESQCRQDPWPSTTVARPPKRRVRSLLVSKPQVQIRHTDRNRTYSSVSLPNALLVQLNGLLYQTARAQESSINCEKTHHRNHVSGVVHLGSTREYIDNTEEMQKKNKGGSQGTNKEMGSTRAFHQDYNTYVSPRPWRSTETIKCISTQRLYDTDP